MSVMVKTEEKSSLYFFPFLGFLYWGRVVCTVNETVQDGVLASESLVD